MNTVFLIRYCDNDIFSSEERERGGRSTGCRTWNSSLEGFRQLHNWSYHGLPSKNILTRLAAHGHALDLDAAAFGKCADLDSGPGRPVV